MLSAMSTSSFTQKRITFILTSLSFAGAQTQVLALAKTLKKRHWDVGVVSMMPKEALAEQLDNEGINWAALDMARGSADVSAIFKLRRLIHDWQPTIVHSHMVHANILTRITRMISKMPVLISTAHNINEGGRLLEMAYRVTDPLCDLTTNVSQAAVDRYIDIGAVPKKKIQLMVNGIDASRFELSENARQTKRQELNLGDTFTWLAIGRFEEAKDYPNMLRAFKKVSEARGGKLLIVGEGGIDMNALIEEHQLEGKVEVLGIRKDVPELMNAADAYLMSSAWEGLPMVLLEAAASALPIVTTNAGGNADALQNGKTGIVVPIENTDALAEAMTRVLDLPESQRKAMGQAGRHFIKATYDLEAIVDKWEDIYAEQLDKKGLAQFA